MGLNRTPTAILEARGSFIGHKNRKDARAGEPVVTKKLGGPPKTLSDEQKKLWREFSKIVPPGVATYADRWAVEIFLCYGEVPSRYYYGRREIPAHQLAF